MKVQARQDLRASVVLCTVKNVELVRPDHPGDLHYPVSTVPT